MQRQRPKNSQNKVNPGNVSKSRPPNITAGWGRGASQYRPGLFTKKYLIQNNEACAADIYSALSAEIVQLNNERAEIEEKPFRRPNYSSFSRYFHWFLILGLITRTGRFEVSQYAFLKKRVYYKLTELGKAEEQAWLDPVRAAHPEYI